MNWLKLAQVEVKYLVSKNLRPLFASFATLPSPVMFFAVYCNLFRYCNWKRFVNYIYDWITSLYIDPRKGLLLLASWHFKRKLSRTAKNCFQINLRHTLLLLLCEGADDVWRLGEHVLRNLPHNIRHCVKVADHLDRWLRHIRFCYVFFFQNFMFPMFSHSICHCVKIADHLDRSCSISTPLISAYTFR